MAQWTLSKNGGDPKLLAELGITNPVIRYVSQAPDILTFTTHQQTLDDSEFGYGDIVELFRDGVRWFFGRVTRVPKYGAPGSESASYEVSGPWWWLDQVVYKIFWTVWFSGSPELAYKSHLFLNKNINNQVLTTAQQISDVITFAKDHAVPPAPIDLASGVPAIFIPVDEVRDMTCGEVIRRQLRWIPDAVTWFDYSAETPTLHIRRRSELTPVTLPIGDGVRHESLPINPRHDLQLPAVELIFEKLTQVNGVTWGTITRQIAPPEATGRELGALVATIDLQGLQATTASFNVVTEDIAIEDVEWWKRRKTTLASDRVRDLQITDAEIDTELPRMIEGGIPPVEGLESQRATAKCKASYVLLRDPELGEVEENIEWRGTVELAVTINATNAETKTYQTGSVSAGDEPEPPGLAAAIFQGVSQLQWEGEYSVVEDDPSRIAGVGNVINLTGGLPEWATMNALIQSVTVDLESGRTTFSFGPPSHLSTGDFIELLRTNRTRFVTGSNASRSTGQPASGANVDLGYGTARENTVEESDRTEILLVKAKEEDGAGSILLDSVQTAGKKLKPRELPVCIKISDDPPVYEEKKVMFICSEPY